MDNEVKAYSRIGFVGAYEKVRDLFIIVEDKANVKYVTLRTTKLGYYLGISNNKIIGMRVLY